MIGRCDKVCDNKTEDGYCRFTGCVNPQYNRAEIKRSICTTCRYLAICGNKIINSATTTLLGCSGYDRQDSITNGDYIRSMRDEELAEWIVRKTDGNGFDGYQERVNAWLDWLKQTHNKG